MSLLILDRIENGEFKSELPFPNSTNLKEHVTYQTKKKEIETLKSRIVLLDSEMADIRRNMRDSWVADTNQRVVDFRNALEQEFGLRNHPRVNTSQKNQLWNIAWNKGHSLGFKAVYEEYVNLLGLLS